MTHPPRRPRPVYLQKSPLKPRMKLFPFSSSSCIAFIAVALFGCSFGPPLEAAAIVAPGIDLNNPSWRTPENLKPLDADGDNIYGTAGYLLFRFASAANSTAISFDNGTNGTLNSLPAYVGVASTPGTGPDRMFGSKAAIDDPNNPGSLVATGVAYRNAGFNNLDSQAYLQVSITGDVPAGGIRLGVLTDNSGVNDPPTSVTLTQISGSGFDMQTYPGAYAGVPEPNWYFFDVLDAVSGDVFEISFGNRLSGFKPTIAGLTLDVIPEPTASALLLSGIGVFGAGRRNRRVQ